jgi:hypothetical protein
MNNQGNVEKFYERNPALHKRRPRENHQQGKISVKIRESRPSISQADVIRADLQVNRSP